MRYVSLLRGVNVGGQRKLKMADLRDLYESLGYEAVETYVQSGNVAFTSPGTEDPARLAGDVTGAIASRFGYGDVAVLLRTANDLAEVVAGNPFVERGEDPARLAVTFLAGEPGGPNMTALDPAGYAPDELAPGRREVYLFCPNGYGRTKLDNAFFERRLGVAATTRNWRTVTKLREMLGG